MIFEDLTIDKLRNEAIGQNRARVTTLVAEMNKKEVCEFIWTIKGITFAPINLEIPTEAENIPQGQLHRAYRMDDILGEKLGSRKIDWAYYPTGEVDTITITDLDANDIIISVKTLKHFRDGREPAFL